MRTSLSLFLVSAFFLLAACSNVSMNVDREAPGTTGARDAAGMKRFALYEPRLGGADDPHGLRDLTRQELERRGYQYDPASPQFLVDARLREDEKPILVQKRRERVESDQLDTAGTTIKHPEEQRLVLERTLLVGVYDAAEVRGGAPLSRSLIWRAAVVTDSPLEVSEIAPCMVKGALAGYPAVGETTLVYALDECPR